MNGVPSVDASLDVGPSRAELAVVAAPDRGARHGRAGGVVDLKFIAYLPIACSSLVLGLVRFLIARSVELFQSYADALVSQAVAVVLKQVRI